MAKKGTLNKVNKPDNRRGIQSVEVGYTLIEALAAAPGKLPLKKLAEAAGMTPSKAHLYLISFMRLGLVVQDETNLRYGLGPGALHLGISAISQLDVVELARRHLPEASEEIQCSICLAVWGNHGPTIVYRVDRALPIPLTTRVGYVLPLLTTATGRTFMAHLPEPVWVSLAKEEGRVGSGRETEVRALLPAIRSSFSATIVGGLHTGFFGVSSPVFATDNSMVAAVTALGLTPEDGSDRLLQLQHEVRDLAQRLSRSMGCRMWDHGN